MPTSGIPRTISHPKATHRPQRTGQRTDQRGNPGFGGEPWGSLNWPVDTADDADDLTSTVFASLDSVTGDMRIAPFASLAAIQADGTWGDGNLGTSPYADATNFASGEFVYLEDGTQAHYNTAAWVTGAAP